jgi:hypothetical protein
MDTLFSNEFVTITRAAHAAWLEVIWHGYSKGAPYREALNHAIALLKGASLTGWLADMRQASVIDNDDLQWLNDDWSPRAIQAGLRDVVMIMPERSIPRMQVQRIERQPAAPESMHMVFFATIDAGRDYLNNLYA